MRALLSLVLIALAGCQPIAMPSVPPVTSEAGRTCVQRCQGLHNECMAGASVAVAAGATRQVTLIDGCRQNLGGCYGMCPH